MPAQTPQRSTTTPPDGSPDDTTASTRDGTATSAWTSDRAKPVRWITLLRLSDTSGDLGLTGGPAYADLTGVRIGDSGERARLAVSLAGAAPTHLANREVVGVGIDIFRSDRQESDYQVYLDGGDQGWRAFLQTPRGFVRFPGTLTLERSNLVVELPWPSLGGRKPGRVAVFVDWSEGSDTLGSSSQDRAPDTGTRLFSPK